MKSQRNAARVPAFVTADFAEGIIGNIFKIAVNSSK